MFPWPRFGSRVIHGSEISEAGLGEVARGRLAGDPGAFLRCFHGLSVPGLDTLPFDPLLALFLGAALALYARAQGMRALEAETLSGLERTLSERS